MSGDAGMQQVDVVNVLSSVPGLWDADSDSLEEMASVLEVLEIDEDWLFHEGEEAQHLFILARGELEVVKRGRDGQQHSVATLTSGVLFGHVPLVTDLARTASVRAPGAATVLAMDIARARTIIGSHDLPHAGPLRRALVVALARQLTAATDTTLRLAVKVGQARPENKQDEPMSLVDALEMARTWT